MGFADDLGMRAFWCQARSAPSAALTAGLSSFGLALIVVHVLVDAPAAKAFTYVAVGVLAVTAIVLATRSGGSRATLAWRTIGVSIGLWVVGDAIWYILNARGGPPYPSAADAFYLLGYPLLALGPLILISSGRSRAALSRDLLDAALVTISALLLLWPFMFEPTVEAGFSLATVTTLTYAAGDLIFVAMFAILWLNPARRTLSVTLVTSAAVLIFIADVTTYFPSLAGVAAAVSDPLWLLGYLLAAIAAIHQTRPIRHQRSVSPMHKLMFVGATLVALPSALLLDAFVADGFERDDWVVLVGGITLALVLVVIRGATMLNDVMAEKRRADDAREQLALVLDNAGVGIAFQRGEFMTATNATLQQLLGYSEAELTRMSYLDVIHPDDLLAAVENRHAGLMRGANTFERRLLRNDGSCFRAQITVTPTPDAGLVAVIEDITDRQLLQRRVAESERLEAVGRLAGGIAHDFNNLLTAVRGNAELIRFADSRGELEDSVDSIIDSSERAAGLVRQLLTFSRQNEFIAEVIDTQQFVQEATALLQRVLGGHVAVEVTIDDATPPVLADRSQLDQVLLNLAVNARDAMPDGGTLSVHVERYDHLSGDLHYVDVESGGYARLTVTDTGSGMSEQTLSRIFEPFFTTKEAGEGTGLGLATTHGIVKRIGGHIHVSSTPGHGTCFEILLPAAAIQATTRPRVAA